MRLLWRSVHLFDLGVVNGHSCVRRLLLFLPLLVRVAFCFGLPDDSRDPVSGQLHELFMDILVLHLLLDVLVELPTLCGV